MIQLFDDKLRSIEVGKQINRFTGSMEAETKKNLNFIDDASFFVFNTKITQSMGGHLILHNYNCLFFTKSYLPSNIRELIMKSTVKKKFTSKTQN